MFVDRVKIFVEAGHGGNGVVSFRREKFVPRGGPDGGDGGRGGSVIVSAKEGVDSLAGLSFRRHWRAANGEPGKGANRHGRNAPDLIIEVPPGTTIFDAEGGFVLKDLAQPNDQVVVAKGGRGGWGNAHFKSATNRAPRQSTPGEPGELRTLILELKSIADVGLIGKPNAGKSTLLSRLTRARPEIADYPFTTKFPNLGRVELDQERSFVLADIPGLIEGAHEGVGLGHEFLRHVERAGILVHLVEPVPLDGSDPLANYEAIRTELRQYDPALVDRPEVVVVTKAELPGADLARRRLAEHLGRKVLSLSAITGQGLNEFLGEVTRLLETHRAEAHTTP
jgi:GTP-binding protein